MGFINRLRRYGRGGVMSSNDILRKASEAQVSIELASDWNRLNIKGRQAILGIFKGV